MSDLQRELAAVLNRHSQEFASDTPDFILAEYLLNCLNAWNVAVRQRDVLTIKPPVRERDPHYEAGLQHDGPPPGPPNPPTPPGWRPFG